MTSQSITVSPTNESTTRTTPTRRSSLRCTQLMTKLRPLPFQYVWSMWLSKPVEQYEPKQLVETVADIGAFYRIFNNFPWDNIKLKDAVHFFRVGVTPLWEDAQNEDGGCWTIKARHEDGKALRVWEELCLMTCGGELQAEIESERDHVLGISYSPRLYWAHISIWTKQGQNSKSISLLQAIILRRLSSDLLPKSEVDYYYKRHNEHGHFKNTATQPDASVGSS